jgi:uncharacterized protein YqgC (DUF456 family)
MIPWLCNQTSGGNQLNDIIYILLGWACIVVGIIGCFLPVLPGPTLAYLALFCAYATGNHCVPSSCTLIVSGIVVAVVSILDYVVPTLGAKKFNCSRGGLIGCAIGTIIGLFFLPLGAILGPFVGALAGESLSGKKLPAALLGATGALLGYLFGIILKLLCCGYIAVEFWRATWKQLLNAVK